MHKAAGASAGPDAKQPIRYPRIVPGIRLDFPRDHGAHPDYRTEWWYVTGILDAGSTNAPDPLGFQVTFFRSRLDTDPANPSAFAPRQLLFAHAALSDPRFGRLRSEQRAAREGFGLALALDADLSVKIDDWSLERDATTGQFRIQLPAREFQLALVLTPTQPILVEGNAGFSQKSPDPGDASEYYSQPHLRVDGAVQTHGKKRLVVGDAWLDREWSSSYLAAEASGWDWIGLNLDDGAALMAFRIRDHSGTALWAGATLRHASGEKQVFPFEAVRFETERIWRSPRSGVSYPVEQRVTVGPYRWHLVPLMQDQELDTSASTGTIYWEGAVRALGFSESAGAASSGHGYLELTGYDQPLKI